MLTKEKGTADSSKLFFFMPSAMDRKEKINKFFNNVHLHPIDCAYEDFSNHFLKKKNILPATSSFEISRRKRSSKRNCFQLLQTYS